MTNSDASPEPAARKAAPAAPAAVTEPRVSAGAFIEENPRLCREARDILPRAHGSERHTRQEWRELADTYGGNR